jgi:AsmA protein
MQENQEPPPALAPGATKRVGSAGMTPRRLTWKWLLLGLVAVLLAAVAAWPRIAGHASHLRERVTAALADWTGGEVRLIGPLSVHYFPEVSIKGGVEIRDISRLPFIESVTAKKARIAIDLPALMLGRIDIDAIWLNDAEIRLKDEMSLPGRRRAELIRDGLTAAPLEIVRLRRSRIVLPPSLGAGSVSDIEARLRTNGGALRGFGSFVLAGEAMHFTVDSGGLAVAGDGLSAPVDLTIDSALLNAKIKGNAIFGDGFELAGDMQIASGKLRQLLRWTGLAFPDGQSLQTLSASGAMRWKGSTINFDNGSFMLDGNTADGALSLTTGARPRIEGTLDFDQLVIDPYLQSGNSAADAPASQPAPDWTLVRDFDADLRISAGEIVASPLKLGQGAFTIAVKHGVLESELGEIELCGGSATGRVGIDAANDVPQVTLTANLSDIAVAACLDPFAQGLTVKGVGSLTADLATQGTTYQELLAGLGGEFKLNAANGAVPIDFARLLTVSSPLESNGWSEKGTLDFNTLSGDCHLLAGHIRCQSFAMQTGRGLIWGTGDIDIEQRTLDWTLSLTDRPTPGATAERDAALPRISIRGPLAQPSIRRADRSTVGEGSAGSMQTQVSPH